MFRISTLTRSKLLPTDHITLSSLPTALINDAPLTYRAWREGKPESEQEKEQEKRIEPFPNGANGYLYYHQENRGMPIATGGIRFRMCGRGGGGGSSTSTDGSGSTSTVPPSEKTKTSMLNPASSKWDVAKDLTIHTHMPWSVRNWSLAITPSLSPLLQLLLADGHLTPTQVDYWQRLYPPEWAERPKFITVHALGEPFVVPLGRKKVVVAVVGRNKVGYFRMYTDFLGEGFYQEREKWFHGSFLTTSISQTCTDTLVQAPP
jgi:hypothetical protein